MESQLPQVPLWAKIVRADEQAKASFLQWIKERQQYVMEMTFFRATDMVIVHAARITHAELATWENILMYEDKENEEYARYLGQTQAN